ncbi:hypothetical protein Tco_1547299 [Tanacetum coccineum]
MELLMIERKILKDQGNPLGTITEDRRAGIGSPHTKDLTMDCSPTCPKSQERSLARSFEQPPRGSNSSAPVVIKAKVFGREVNRVHMDSGSSCKEKSPGLLGKFPLEITIGDPPLTRKETLNFQIAKSDSPYNMLLGRTAMQKMEIVVSTIYGAIKFHTTRGIEEKVVVNNKYLEQTIAIEKQLPKHFKRRLRDLLRANEDVFTWNHADMTGIPRTIIVKGKSFNTEHKSRETNEGRNSVRSQASDMGSQPSHGRIPLGIATEMLLGYLQGLSIDSNGRNLEAYVDDMVIKSTFEEEMLADIKETFEKFRSFNMKLNLKKCSFGVEEGPFLGHLITKQGIRANPLKVKAITNIEQPKTLKDVKSLNGKIEALSRFLSKDAKRSLPFFKVLKSCTDKKNIQWTQEAEAALQEIKKFMEIMPTLTVLVQGEILMMYLTASTESISAALFVKREEERVPIYFQGGYEERGDKTHKDFLIEVPLEDNEKKVEEKADMKSMKTTDANRPRGKRIYLCLTLRIRNNKQRSRIRSTIGRVANIIGNGNYKLGNLYRLTVAGKSNKRYLRSQATNDQRILTEDQRGFEGLRQLHGRAYPKEHKKTDALSKLASMTFEHLTTEVLVEVLLKRSIEEKEILQVETKEGESWMTPIHEYLVSGLLPEDPKESRKIRIKAPQYKLIRRNLYRRSFYTTWLRCIASPHTDNIIKEVYEGSCGFNAEPRSMVVRITMQGYYNPSMHRDAAKVLQDCEKCKEQSAIRKVAESNIITAESGWPFSHWGVNILGPLPTAPGEGSVWVYVVCRFEVPRTISSKDGKHFQEGIFTDLSKGLKVTQSFFPITEHMEIMNHTKNNRPEVNKDEWTSTVGT